MVLTCRLSSSEPSQKSAAASPPPIPWPIPLDLLESELRLRNPEEADGTRIHFKTPKGGVETVLDAEEQMGSIVRAIQKTNSIRVMLPDVGPVPPEKIHQIETV